MIQVKSQELPHPLDQAQCKAGENLCQVKEIRVTGWGREGEGVGDNPKMNVMNLLVPFDIKWLNTSSVILSCLLCYHWNEGNWFLMPRRACCISGRLCFHWVS